ncbi:MAG: universal stress protein [Cellulomonadaceae bacterium]
MARKDVVLVGVDGSTPSLYALDWAVAQAGRTGWGVHVVCTYSLPSFTAASLDGGYAALDDTAILEGAKAIVEEAKSRAQAAGARVTASVATGDPAGVLVEMSKQYGLVVVGTRGRGGFTGRLLGTVSSALPAHAKCPVVVVPYTDEKEQAPTPGPLEEAGFTNRGNRPLIPVRRIVVGVDGSATAERALRAAIAQAQIWECELVAVAGVPVGSGVGMLSWLPAAVDHEAVLADVAEGLNVIVDRVLKDYPGATVRRIVLDGSGAELLTEFSTASDLVVVGSRGRGGFTGLLLGSTSQAVLHHSKCPVMVITKHCAD